MKEEERDLGTSAWARHLNEASRITPQVKQYFKHFEHAFIGKRDHEVLSTESMVDRSFSTAYLIFLVLVTEYYIFVVLFFIVVVFSHSG